MKKQQLTDLSLVSLIKTMSETYSIVDELKDIPEKIKSLEAVITLILQQISECALFVREYVHPSFAGGFSLSPCVSKVLEKSQAGLSNNYGRTRAQRFRISWLGLRSLV